MFDRRLLFNFDWLLLLITCILGIIGVVSIYSVSHTSAAAIPLYKKHIYYFLFGLCILLFSLVFHYNYLERYAYHIYTVSIILLFLVFPFGRITNGARRWLDVGFISFQPSEFVKIATILALSKYIANKGVIHMGLGFRALVIPFVIVSIPFVMLAMEPDLGTALIIFFIFISMVLFAKVNKRTLIIFACAAAIILPLSWGMLKDYQKERIFAFLNPELDPLGAGYHIIQSKIAVGSGGFWGKGFLHGTQSKLRFLPAQHTDFIFSVFAEEWGFVGSIILLSLYLILILWGLNIVRRSKDRFGAYLAYGIISMFIWHIFINIGMVIGILPVVGVPLPFMSYGGSFLVTATIGVGILMNIHMRRYMF